MSNIIIEELLATIARAPRDRLPAIRAAMYADYDAGRLTETEAEEIERAINARAQHVVIAPPSPRRVGSRPRTPESLARRRRWAASGRLPPQIAHCYSPAEQATLSVIAMQVAKHGTCTWTIAHIAAVAGIAYSTAKAALRKARDLGHITATHRPRPGGRHDSNVVNVVALVWQAWMRLHRRDVAYHGADVFHPGDIFAAGSSTGDLSGRRRTQRKPLEEASEKASRPPRSQILRRRSAEM